MWVNTMDNEIANDENVAGMLSVFTKTNADTLTIYSDDYGLDGIGHMKFFSKKS